MSNEKNVQAKKWLLLEWHQFWPNQSDGSEVVIFTKFHKVRVKIAILLLKSNFWASLLFNYSYFRSMIFIFRKCMLCSPGTTNMTSPSPLLAGAIAVKWLQAPSFNSRRSINLYAKANWRLILVFSSTGFSSWGLTAFFAL